MLDFLALVAGVALPWTFGMALASVAYARTPTVQPPASWIAGCGWFVGIFVLTLLMRAVSALGIKLSVAAVALPFAFATITLVWWARRPSATPFATLARNVLSALGGAGLDGWQRLAWRLLVAWLALRFALLFAEVWWRPLYPWDAWTQWGTKARVWFELHSIVPFVGPADWLSARVPGAYSDAAPHYPATVPLFQVWAALVLGRWDDALVNGPWWASGVAFAFALHGALRRFGFAPLVALGGAALAITLPIVNVHVALAGYADLPMAAYLTLGSLAALLAVRERSVADAMLAAVLLIACALVKNPGKAWIVIVAVAAIVAAWPRWGLRFAVVAFVGAGLAILALSRTGIRILGYQLTQDVKMAWGALFDAYFSFANWNLLWYCAVATAIVGWKQLVARDVAPLTAIVAGGLMFLLVGFAFTNAGIWVEDQSTVNRATLHLAPLIVVWMLAVLRAWHAERRESAAALVATSG